MIFRITADLSAYLEPISQRGTIPYPWDTLTHVYKAQCGPDLATAYPQRPDPCRSGKRKLS